VISDPRSPGPIYAEPDSLSPLPPLPSLTASTSSPSTSSPSKALPSRPSPRRHQSALTTTGTLAATMGGLSSPLARLFGRGVVKEEEEEEREKRRVRDVSQAMVEEEREGLKAELGEMRLRMERMEQMLMLLWVLLASLCLQLGGALIFILRRFFLFVP
jgi:hypothetical protein